MFTHKHKGSKSKRTSKRDKKQLANIVPLKAAPMFSPPCKLIEGILILKHNSNLCMCSSDICTFAILVSTFLLWKHTFHARVLLCNGVIGHVLRQKARKVQKHIQFIQNYHSINCITVKELQVPVHNVNHTNLKDWQLQDKGTQKNTLGTP